VIAFEWGGDVSAVNLRRKKKRGWFILSPMAKKGGNDPVRKGKRIRGEMKGLRVPGEEEEYQPATPYLGRRPGGGKEGKKKTSMRKGGRNKEGRIPMFRGKEFFSAEKDANNEGEGRIGSKKNRCLRC